MSTDRIVRLRFPDNIRLRPGLFLGNYGLSMAEDGFMQLLGLLSEEAADGFSREIDVKICRDHSVELRSNNRGLRLGTVSEGDGAEWVSVFLKFFPEDDDGPLDLLSKRSRFAEKGDGYTAMNMHELGKQHATLCQNQCVCEYMEIESVRDGFVRRLRFEKGLNVGGLREEKSDSEASTCLRFRYDKEVLGDITLSYGFVCEQLRRLAMLNMGVTFRLEYLADGQSCSDSFLYSEGARDYVKELTQGLETSEVYEFVVMEEGRDREELKEYTARLGVTFAFCKDKSHIETFHNYRLLEWGGDHTDRIVDGLCRVIGSRIKGRKLTKRELTEHLVLIVVGNSERCWSRWNDEGARSLANEMIADMADRLFDSEDTGMQAVLESVDVSKIF